MFSICPKTRADYGACLSRQGHWKLAGVKPATAGARPGQTTTKQRTPAGLQEVREVKNALVVQVFPLKTAAASLALDHHHRRPKDVQT